MGGKQSKSCSVDPDVAVDPDVVAPDNDPPQQMGDPSVVVTKESLEASRAAKRKAMEAISVDQLEEAIQRLNEAILLDPLQGSKIAKRKGMEAISEGNLEEAEKHLTEAILLNPKSAILYGIRASVYITKKKPNAAIRDADEALKVNPNCVKGYKYRGMAYSLLGRWVEAGIDLMEAACIDFDEEISSEIRKVAAKRDEKVEKDADEFIKGCEEKRRRRRAEAEAKRREQSSSSRDPGGSSYYMPRDPHDEPWNRFHDNNMRHENWRRADDEFARRTFDMHDENWRRTHNMHHGMGMGPGGFSPAMEPGGSSGDAGMGFSPAMDPGGLSGGMGFSPAMGPGGFSGGML